MEDKVFSFLGIPIGSNPRQIASLKPLLEKIKVTLSSWKGKMLSIRGRVTLVKSVFGSISIFLMDFYKASITV